MSRWYDEALLNEHADWGRGDPEVFRVGELTPPEPDPCPVNEQIGEYCGQFHGTGRDVTEIMRIAVRKPWLVPHNDARMTRTPPLGGSFSEADYEAWQAAQR